MIISLSFIIANIHCEYIKSANLLVRGNRVYFIFICLLYENRASPNHILLINVDKNNEND